MVQFMFLLAGAGASSPSTDRRFVSFWLLKASPSMITSLHKWKPSRYEGVPQKARPRT
jgi:hypothetical protein